jgi:type I restriction enzyme S subunit
MRLGDIATRMFRGSGIKRDEVTKEGIPCVRYGEIYTAYGIWFNNCLSKTNEDLTQNKKYFSYGDILFAITGESIAEIAKSTVYLGNDECLAGGDIVVMKHKQNPKYLAFALSTTAAQQQKSKGKVKSKVVHSSIPALSDIKIPIPSIKEQDRIVNILDHFNCIVNDISQGLPAEIAARRKQYEYYRNKLLSFKEVSHEPI